MTQYQVLDTAIEAKATHEQPPNNNQQGEGQEDIVAKLQAALKKFFEWVKTSNLALWLVGLVVTAIIIHYFKPATKCTKCLCPDGFQTFLLVGNGDYNDSSSYGYNYSSIVYCVRQSDIAGCNDSCSDTVNIYIRN